jgi:hypothetical protein
MRIQIAVTPEESFNFFSKIETPGCEFIWNRRRRKTRPRMAGSAKSNESTSMTSTTTSCRFVELYEKRMRRFNLTVLSAAAVALAVASLLMLNS